MKKNNMKRVFTLLLAVMVAAVFAGCGIAQKDSNGGGTVDTPKPAETTLEGTYCAEFDMCDIVAAQITAEYDIDASAPLIMNMKMILNDDDTYEMSFDLQQFLANTENYYYQIFPDLIKTIFADEGIAEADIESTLQSSGYSGLSEYMDEMVAEAMESVRSEYADGEDMITQGTYKVDGDKIMFYEDGGSVSTDHGVINSDGSITIEDIDMEGEIVDITFTK